MGFLSNIIVGDIEDSIEEKVSFLIPKIICSSSNISTILIILDKDFDYKNLDRKWYKSLKIKCKNTITNYKTQTIDFIIATEKSGKCSHKKICHITRNLNKRLDNINVGLVKHKKCEDLNDIYCQINNNIISFDHCIITNKIYLDCLTNSSFSIYNAKSKDATNTYSRSTSLPHPGDLAQIQHPFNLINQTLTRKINNIEENSKLVNVLFPKGGVPSLMINIVSIMFTFANIFNKDTDNVVLYDDNLPAFLKIKYYNIMIIA